MFKTFYRKYVLDDLPQFDLPPDRILDCSNAVLFHHIPKNAGTSFRDILTKNYSRTERLYFYGNSENIQASFQTRESSNKTAREVKCIATHKPKDWLKHLNPSYQAISFIRHPLARTISLYYYLINIPVERKWEGGYKIAEVIREQNLSLEDIYDKQCDLSPQTSPFKNLFSGFFNGQYRHLIGPYQNVRKVTYTNSLSFESIPYLSEMQLILDRHYNLGIVEEFNTSADKLARAFDWSIQSYPYNLSGQHPSSKEISPSLETKILHHNKIDMLLWKLTQFNILHETNFNLNWNLAERYFQLDEAMNLRSQTYEH